jgi:hypothetical protein
VSAFTLGQMPCGNAVAHLPAHAPAAEYAWVSGISGSETYLCAQCCADWRYVAEGDSSLTPRRIRSVEHPVLSIAPVGSDPDDAAAWTPIGTADPVAIEWSAP